MQRCFPNSPQVFFLILFLLAPACQKNSPVSSGEEESEREEGFVAQTDFVDLGDSYYRPLQSRCPAVGQSAVPLNSRIELRFDHSMAEDSVSSESIRVFHNNSPLGGAVSADGNLLLFEPSMPLPSNSTLEVVVAPALRFSSDHELQREIRWSFVTGDRAGTALVTNPTLGKKTRGYPSH